MPGFEEEQHPRDDHGRFSSGGGGGLASWAKSRDPSIPKRTWTDDRPKDLPEETWMRHYDKDPREGGKPSAERVRDVHEPIMREALKAKPAGEHEQKLAIMTMGGPGSGKSSMLRSVDESKFVKVDPDDVRTKLPEYKQATSGDTVYRNASAMVHEEASDISKKILDKAIQNGQHVIVDGTGSSADSMIKKMKKLKDAGYHVHLMFAHLDNPDEAMHRVASRAEKTGRYVPESFVRDAYNKIPKNFEKVAREAHSFAVFDTSRRDAPMVWEKEGNGIERRHDPAFVANFKLQHGENRAK